MKLSIITINYNNAEGLRKTLASVAAQTYPNIEHIIVDGASTDGSVEVVKAYALGTACAASGSPAHNAHHQILWISEPDKGIYNAMNKGIKMATGDYCQFLNSGDILINDFCTQQMVETLVKANEAKGETLKIKGEECCGADSNTQNLSPITYNLDNRFAVIYGNMKKEMPDGRIVHDPCASGKVTLNMFYHGCLNHSPAYIRRNLFDKYGLYDETLRICSDWKFYLQSLVLGSESVKYVDIDMTLFDMTGISETNKDLLNNERNRLLQELIPVAILKDYDEFHFPMIQYHRLKKYHFWGLVHFIERVLFKFEKWFTK